MTRKNKRVIDHIFKRENIESEEMAHRRHPPLFHCLGDTDFLDFTDRVSRGKPEEF